MRTVLLLLLAGCNGGSKVDCAHPSTWYPDADGDGFGAEEGEQACSPPDGHVDRSGDCNDGDPEVYFGATESCNGVDDDCDGVVDPDDAVDASPCYTDHDADGYGVNPSGAAACDCPEGTAHGTDDCDDYDEDVHPGAQETWYDGTDSDCLGDDDDDADADGYPGDGWDATDCDDQNPAIHPDATEVCNNGIDENCDGAAPECGVGGIMTPDHAETSIEGHIPGYFADDVVYAGDNDGDGVPEVISAFCPFFPEDEEQAQLEYRVYDVPSGAALDADVDTVAVFEPPGFLLNWGDTRNYTGCPAWHHIAAGQDLDGDGAGDFLIGSPTWGGSTTTPDSRVDLWFGPAIGTIDLSDAETAMAAGTRRNFGDSVALLEFDSAGSFTLAVGRATVEAFTEEEADTFVLDERHFLDGESIADAPGIFAPGELGIEPSHDAADVDGDGFSDLALGVFANYTDTEGDPSRIVMLGPFEDDRWTDDAELTIAPREPGGEAGWGIGFEHDSPSGQPRVAVMLGIEDCDEGDDCGAVYVHEFEEGVHDLWDDAVVTLVGPPRSWSGHNGAFVTWGGDLDDDGTPELIVQAEGDWFAGPLGFNWGTHAFVVEVPDSGTWYLEDLAEAMIWSTEDLFGDLDLSRSPLVGHDFTSDGIDDLVLGSPNWNAGYEDDSMYEDDYYGRILMFEGGPTGY